MIKIAFLGTPSIGAKALESLIDSKQMEVEVVVTVPDRAIGRSHSTLQPSPVAKVAKEHNIQTIKTDSINRDLEKLKLFEFDYLVTCAFGQILSNDILSLPKKKAINIHGSLLPEGRGGAPLHWAIIKGKTKTGITIMEMVEEMDAGDYYSQFDIKISSLDDVTSLFSKVGDLIYEKTAEGIMEIENGKEPIKQNEKKVSYWLNIKRKDSKIDFNNSAKDICNLIRGLEKVPGAWAMLNDKIIKIHKAQIVKGTIDSATSEPGTITNISEKGIFIQTKEGVINVTEVTIEGSSRNTIDNLINSNIFIKHDKFK